MDALGDEPLMGGGGGVRQVWARIRGVVTVQVIHLVRLASVVRGMAVRSGCCRLPLLFGLASPVTFFRGDSCVWLALLGAASFAPIIF